MQYQHKGLATGRWAQMSLSEQMANIGSEISRALNWKRKNNEKSIKGSCTWAGSGKPEYT